MNAQFSAERLHRLEARERQLDAILANSVDCAIITTDLSGKITEWNAGAEQILGWTAADIIGQPIGALFTPEDRQSVQVEQEMLLADSNGRTPDERWHLRKDGSRFLAFGELTPLKDGKGQQFGYLKILRDQTERRETSAALQAAELSEERYRAILNSTDVGFCVLEMVFDGYGKAVDYAFVETNAAFENQTGLVGAAGKSARQLVPALEQHWIDAYAEVALTRKPKRFEDGSEAMGRWFDVYALPVDRPGAHKVALLFHDLTSRRRTELALRASEERFRTALELDTVGTIYFDADGRLTDANEGFLRASGFSIQNVRSGVLTWQNLTPPDWKDDSERAFAELRSKGQTIPYEKQYFRADGSRWWALVAAKLLPDGTGFEFVLDITARKHAEAALNRLNQDLERRVAERTADRNRMWVLSSDIMLVADFSARIHAVNPAWTSLLGWSEQALVGADFMSLIHPDDAAATAAEVGKLADGVTTLRFENRYRHQDGSYRWMSWTAVPDERFIHAVGRDIQAEKEAQEALARAEEALRQSQKMEAVGQLTGGLAHDFNNLLTGITGSLELLSSRIAQGRLADVERYTTAAQGAAKRAAALTHRLLAFSRRQTLDPRPTDVNRLITGIEELVRRTVGPEITVEVAQSAGLWITAVDPNQLENALLNLCINARDAMPEGGRITVETANRWLDKRAASERDMEAGQYVALSVSDTGTGMTPDIIAKAFDPFFTTKPLGMGTGLGLSMIYGFARQSGGQVRIYSELGQGSTLTIYLPRHFGKAQNAEPVRDLADAPQAEAGETVLVVDDEPTVRMLVTEVLEELGYAAIEASDGPSGLKILRSDVRIDLLVTDVGLPGGMNGRQMADAGRESRPDLRVLFITGYAENAVVGNGHLAPGMHVLTKPFTMEGLAGRIRELISAHADR